VGVAVCSGHVVALGGDDVSHAAPWVGDVGLVAGDEVDVQAEDGLARGFSDVDADAKAVRAVAAGDQGAVKRTAGGGRR
jgi:hypothetical protein